MSDPCCPFIKSDDTPCAAHPLPGRPFCLFHDPEQTDRLAEGRSRGGAAPRRRLRRYPRLLDRWHIAELLGEFFVASLNDPTAVDSKHLLAINNLARTLLKAVGMAGDQYLVHDNRTEPAATSDHLLRIYPPLSPDVDALLAAEPPASLAADLTSGGPTAAAGDPRAGEPGTPSEPPDARTPERLNAETPSPGPAERSAAASPDLSPRLVAMPEAVNAAERQPVAQDRGQVLDRSGTGAPATEAPCDPLLTSLLPPAPAAPSPARAGEPTTETLPEPLNARTPVHPTSEQVPNRPGTGPSPTGAEAPHSPSAGSRLPSAEPPRSEPPPHPPAPAPAPHPAGEETPGISSLRRETRHSASALGGYGPAPGCVICDIPLRPPQP